MRLILLATLAIGLTATALAPVAAADNPSDVFADLCRSITPDPRCAAVYDPGQPIDGCGPRPSPDAHPGSSCILPQNCERAGQKICAAIACGHPLWSSLPPVPSPDCLTWICRNVPPLYRTVVIRTAPVTTLLGSLPGTTFLVNVLTRAGLSCDDGTGTGGGGCPLIVWTPVAQVGFDTLNYVYTASGTLWNCAWAQSTIGGYDYVGETHRTTYDVGTFQCRTDTWLTVVIAPYGRTYHVWDQC